jgi:hypothetical protein
LGGNTINGCVWKMVSTVIDLNGEWRAFSSPQANMKRVISVSGSSFTIRFPDRPTAFGMIVDPTTITATFPGSVTETVTGKLEQPNRIKWLFSNSQVEWTKPKLPKDWSILEGEWKALEDNSQGPPRARIFMSSLTISINMSEYGRPTAHGSILDDFTFSVTFPDAGTFTGKMEKPNRINWSNGTVWKRHFSEG